MTDPDVIYIDQESFRYLAECCVLTNIGFTPPPTPKPSKPPKRPGYVGIDGNAALRKQTRARERSRALGATERVLRRRLRR